MKEELLKGLSEEQIAKVKACKSQEEILAMAKEEGLELSDEQLEAVSGGNCYPTCYSDKGCPICHGHDCQKIYNDKICYYYCNKCEKHFS